MAYESQPWGVSVNPEAPPAPPPSLGRRFFGGPPLSVLVRLIFVSLVVGAVLMWLHLQPSDIFLAGYRALHHLWAMGYLAAGELGQYFLAGIVIVLPIWFVVRLLSFRGMR